MTKQITARPKTYHFLIGALEVASIRFRNGYAVLETKTAREEFPTMSAALKYMHKMLNSAPEEESVE